MICENCESNVRDGARYCPDCGAELNEPVEGTPSPRSPRQQPRQQRPYSNQKADNRQSSTRVLALTGAGVAAIALFLPWVSSRTGGLSASMVEMGFIPIAVGTVAVAGVPPLLGWGSGWGRLASLVAGVGGAGVAGFGAVMFWSFSQTSALYTHRVRGVDVPVAAMQPEIGILVFAGAGILIVVAALASLINSFR